MLLLRISFVLSGFAATVCILSFRGSWAAPSHLVTHDVLQALQAFVSQAQQNNILFPQIHSTYIISFVKLLEAEQPEMIEMEPLPLAGHTWFDLTILICILCVLWQALQDKEPHHGKDFLFLSCPQGKRTP